MEDFIIKKYYDFLEEKGLKNTKENVDLYISAIYYDILDDLDIECGNFGVPKDLEGFEAQKYIEEQIENILIREVC